MKRIGLFLYHNPHVRRNKPYLVGLIETEVGEERSISATPLLWLGERDVPDEIGFLGAALLEIPEDLEEFFAHSVLIGQVSLTENVLEAIRDGRSADLELKLLHRGNYHKAIAAATALEAESESVSGNTAADTAESADQT